MKKRMLKSEDYFHGYRNLEKVGRRFEYRSLVIHEHYKLIYYINDNNGVIYITDLFDTRREPKRLAENI